MKNILFAMSFVFGFGCGCSNPEMKDREVVQKQQHQYSVAQPIPYFDWSLERETAIQIYKLRNKNIRTWSVWRSNTGMIEGDCESIGFPLPYDVQLTNPLQPYRDNGSAVVEQAEPNGLFSSKSTTATWIRSIHRGKNGKVLEVPIYVESKVNCFPYPIKVDYEKNRVQPADTDEEPTAIIKTREKPNNLEKR